MGTDLVEGEALLRKSCYPGCQPQILAIICYCLTDNVQVCELTPDYDNSGVSAQVAASSAYEIMCLALNNV